MRKSGCEDESPFSIPTSPLLLIISGPSGAGKDAILARLKKLETPLEFIVTATTRPRRPQETDGTNYHFLSEDSFKKMINSGELLEWATVYGNWYGVPREPVKKALDGGRDVIIKVDIQGADTIKKILPDAVSIFLAAPSLEELNQRLRQRNTESAAELELRLKTAIEEMKRRHQFDYIVVNQPQRLDRVASDIRAIITAEKLRLTPREYNL